MLCGKFSSGEVGALVSAEPGQKVARQNWLAWPRRNRKDRVLHGTTIHRPHGVPQQQGFEIGEVDDAIQFGHRVKAREPVGERQAQQAAGLLRFSLCLTLRQSNRLSLLPLILEQARALNLETAVAGAA